MTAPTLPQGADPGQPAAGNAYTLKKFSRIPWAQVIDLLGSTAHIRGGEVHFQHAASAMGPFRQLVISDNGGEVNIHEMIPALSHSIPIPDRLDMVEFASTIADALSTTVPAVPAAPGQDPNEALIIQGGKIVRRRDFKDALVAKTPAAPVNEEPPAEKAFFKWRMLHPVTGIVLIEYPPDMTQQQLVDAICVVLGDPTPSEPIRDTWPPEFMGVGGLTGSWIKGTQGAELAPVAFDGPKASELGHREATAQATPFPTDPSGGLGFAVKCPECGAEPGWKCKIESIGLCAAHTARISLEAQGQAQAGERVT